MPAAMRKRAVATKRKRAAARRRASIVQLADRVELLESIIFVHRLVAALIFSVMAPAPRHRADARRFFRPIHAQANAASSPLKEGPG
jgi:hypothetical protein